MEVTIVENGINEEEIEVSCVYIDGSIVIESIDAVKFQIDFDSLIKKYEQS